MLGWSRQSSPRPRGAVATFALDEVAIRNASVIEPEADRLRALAGDADPETAEYLMQALGELPATRAGS